MTAIEMEELLGALYNAADRAGRIEPSAVAALDLLMDELYKLSEAKKNKK